MTYRIRTWQAFVSMGLMTSFLDCVLRVPRQWETVEVPGVGCWYGHLVCTTICSNLDK